jgi:diguanylate cyclase (GGDEF)-like protein
MDVVDATLGRRLAPRERSALRCALVLLALIVVVGVANLLGGVGGATVTTLIRTWAAALAYVLAAAIVVLRAVRIPDRRPAWILLAIGLSLYGAGNIVWTVLYDQLAAPPIPSISDVLWLALYPTSYLGLVLLARERDRAVPAGVWLDGIVAGLGFAALGAAVVFGPVLDSATGSASAVVTNLAYPIADLLLAALVVGLLALRGWRLNASWTLLGGSFLALYVADSVYLLRVAAGSAQTSLEPNVFYLAGVLLLALAAWRGQPQDAPVHVERWSVLVVPTASIVTAIGVLVYDHFSPLDPLALSLAVAALLAAIIRTAITFRDVRALAVTRREAVTDDLTSLPNRRLFLRTVDDTIAAATAGGDSVALLIVDLDHFKQLNDTLGHHAGDLLLSQIGPRVGAVLREQDMLARLCGDEFAVLLAAPCDVTVARGVADRIGDALRRPFEVEGVHLHVGASIGIAVLPEHAKDAPELLRRADVAMYQAKVAHSGREVYASHRDTHKPDSLALASELPDAIASGQLVLYFQPKADTTSGRIVGMEGLVRWQHPRRGLQPPSDFVGLAEQAGLMRELTRVVLTSALAHCGVWREAGHDVHVAVNVSFTDLLDAQFPLDVATVLAQQAIDPAALVLEITESSIMSDATRIGGVLARLSEFGVRISLDDFGTGYSSLSHLRAMPVSEVKVDRSFVGHMRSDPTDDAIVRSMIGLAHNLGMLIVAEGVEDRATWTALARLGCDVIQGYCLSPPLPSGEALTFLDASRRSLPAAPAADGGRGSAAAAERLSRARGRARLDLQALLPTKADRVCEGGLPRTAGVSPIAAQPDPLALVAGTSPVAVGIFPPPITARADTRRRPRPDL